MFWWRMVSYVHFLLVFSSCAELMGEVLDCTGVSPGEGHICPSVRWSVTC